MRNGEQPAAVRVLPPGGVTPREPPQPPPDRRPRTLWPVPIGLTLLVALIVSALHGSGSTEVTVSSTAPPLAAADPQLVDLRSTSPQSDTTGWDNQAPIEGAAEVTDLIAYNNNFIAVGADASGAQAWLSSTGGGWRPVPRLEEPEGADSRIVRAVEWNGDIVALGTVDNVPAVWTAGSVSKWDYRGKLGEMAGRSIIDLVAGDQLLAVTQAEGLYEGWTSPNGITWAPTGPIGARDDMSILTFGASADWYFAAGQEMCNEPRCRPVIYRSRDAVNWEPTSGVLPGTLSLEPGAVTDITATSEGLIAVGSIGSYPHNDLAIWTSADGGRWSRLAEDEPTLRAVSTRLEVTEVSAGREPAATVVTDTSGPVRLVAGSEIITDAGTARIGGFSGSEVQLSIDGTVERLGFDGAITLHRGALAQFVAGEGTRIIVAGYLVGEQTRSPVIWSSADAGDTWERTILDSGEQTWLQQVAIAGRHIALAAEAASSPITRYSEWDTAGLEAGGLAAVRAYVAAINERDAAAVAALLPVQVDASPRYAFRVPALGDIDLDWWDPDTGAPDTGAIQNVFDYLDSVHATIDLETCNAMARLGRTDSLRVTCEFSTTSDLMETLLGASRTGQIESTIEDGALHNLSLTRSPATQMWEMLNAAAGGAPAADQATVRTVNSSGYSIFEPSFTAETAAVHLRLAINLMGSALHPGDTRTVDTALGRMELQWLTTMPAAAHNFSQVVYTGSEFVAIGQGDYNTDPEAGYSLWSSPDGRAWTEFDPPPDVDNVFDLHSFQGGLAAQAWRADQLLLVFFDGSSWSEVALPAPSSDYYGFRVASTGDRLLAIADAPSRQSAWLVDGDHRLRETALPLDFTGEIMGLGGSEDGFVLAAPVASTGVIIWYSGDGAHWERIVASAPLDDVQWFWNLERHRSRYFVVGQDVESRCLTSAELGTYCSQLVHLWSSPDGGAWDQVRTDKGESVASSQVGSGPLGLVALGQDYYSPVLPRPIYLSPDGAAWQRLGNLTLFATDSSWWAETPAVGTSTIVIPGSLYNEQTNADTGFLIVGHLLP